MKTVFRLCCAASCASLLGPAFRLAAEPEPILGEAPPPPTPAQVEVMRGLAPTILGPTLPITVDIHSRECVRQMFNTLYRASVDFDTGWTGDIATCAPGTTTPELKDLVALRINYYRAMAGVPAVITFNPVFSDKSQQAAMMMSANNTLSHTPPPSWNCATTEGIEAAGNSNLALGSTGPDSIIGYMRDHGGGNTAAGHRRWLLYPQTVTMGTGDVPATDPATIPAANSTWVFDGNFGSARPATRDEFVCWPPAGIVPYQVVYPRWSFSYPSAGFGSATVTMTSGGNALPVRLEPVSNGAGENTIVWVPNNLDAGSFQTVWPKPDQDTDYVVQVQNVMVGGSPRDFTYTVTVFDPTIPGQDFTEPAISGPSQPGVGQANPYTFGSVINATRYQWRQSHSAPFTIVEGAQNGLTDFVDETSADYPSITSVAGATGGLAFHLAHPPPPNAGDQRLVYLRTLLPGAGAEIQFRSRLGWATDSQIAHVQASTDEGGSWEDVYTQPGSGGSGEGSFNSRTAPLSQFQGKSIQIRFLYEYTPGQSFFPGANDGVGWYIDDISFSDTLELTDPIITDIPSGTSFDFTPTEVADFLLDVRAVVYGDYPLGWGPALPVTSTDNVPPTLTITGFPTVTGGQVLLDFEVTNFQPGLTFQLLRTDNLNSSFSPDAAATFQTLVPDSIFRATTTTAGASQGYFRIQAQ